MKTTYLLFCLLSLSVKLIAQKTISGNISDYNSGDGLIIFRDIVTAEKFIWGEIDTDGMFTVLLKENHIKMVNN